MLVDGICVIKMIKKYALKMQVHDVFYNLEFTKLKVTAAWSVQAEVTRGSEAKFNVRCDSISRNVFTQYVTNDLLWCILSSLNAIIFFYHILTCFISCKYEAYFYTSTMYLLISIEAMYLAVMNEV